MVIYQINSVVNRGSTGRIAENIGRLILAENSKSYIAYGRNKEDSASTLIKVGNKIDVYLHVLHTRLFDRHGFASKRATRKLINNIKKINPDIIHLHNIHGYYINIEILFNYLSASNKPVVWTLHDCWAFTGHCVHFESIQCEKWKELCYNCPGIRTYPKSCFFDNSTNNFKQKMRLFSSIKNLTLVPVSNWLNSTLTYSFLSLFESHVINNGINLELFNFKNNNVCSLLKRNLQKKIILCVTNVWTEKKGLSDIFTLSHLLNNDYQIIIIGLTRKQLKKLPSKILGIERTDSIESLAEYYSVANVYLNPTYEDTFPTTNLEALACGTPIVTYRTGGSPESIDDNTGFIVEKGDINGLYEKIKFICDKGKDFYQHNCRKRAEQFYNMNDRYQDYIELYKKILNK